MVTKLAVSTAFCLSALSMTGCKEEDGSATSGGDGQLQRLDARSSATTAPSPRPQSTTGTTDNDRLVGTGLDDTINAGGGDDEVYGGAGADSLTGGDGDDLIVGDGAIPAAPQGTADGDGPFIVLDDFGYRPDMKKVAIIRNPVTGFDASDELVPEPEYHVVRSTDAEVVFTGTPTAWNNGATDDTSGDTVWWFDFSAVTAPGTYTVRDAAFIVVSPEFRIADDVYKEALKDAVRTFYYQRAGFAKTAPYVPAGYADSASHVGPGQDTEARQYNLPDDASSERDLHGGWYDAGDYNKYTNWHAAYVVSLLNSYIENPAVWTDDFNIPESGNGVPDLLDEIKFGLDWLVRMQNADGSVLSIVGLADGSPPSAATGPSYYGLANTSATLSTAAAMALGSKVFGDLTVAGYSGFADDLSDRAEAAGAWADANPAVLFYNNDFASGTQGLGAGQQEMSETARTEKKLSAAIYLADATGKSVYHDYVTANYTASKLVGSYYINGFEGDSQRDLLHYTQVVGANPTVVDTIRSRYEGAMNFTYFWPAVDNATDAYRAFSHAIVWGSNAIKSQEGSLFWQQHQYAIGTRTGQEAKDAAAAYLHYLHGANPLGLAYLSNMADAGAERSVDTFYHSWFRDGSADFDSVATSTYGPAPGYLVGGPNPGYSWEDCCPYSCGSPENNAKCKGTEQPAPPYGQPAQKAYAQFNDSWPLNSWEVTENSNGYQVAYIRLLSKFVD